MLEVVLRNMLEKMGLESTRVAIDPCLLSGFEVNLPFPDPRWKVLDLIFPSSLVGAIGEVGPSAQVLLVDNLQGILAMESIVAIKDKKNIVGTSYRLDEAK